LVREKWGVDFKKKRQCTGHVPHNQNLQKPVSSPPGPSKTKKDNVEKGLPFRASLEFQNFREEPWEKKNCM